MVKSGIADISTVLSKFGLSGKEISIYLMLLRMGEMTASETSRALNINRTFTYDVLKRLINLGFVGSIIKNNKTYFQASTPSILNSILKERGDELNSIIPLLESIKTKQKNPVDIQVFTGKNGIKYVLNMILKTKRKIFVYGSLFSFKDMMGSFFDIWNNKRVLNKVCIRALSFDDIRLKLSEIDLLPDDEKTNTTVFVSDDLFITIVWSDSPIALFVRNEMVVKEQLSIFGRIWGRKVKVYTGARGVRKAFMELLDDTKEYMGYGYSKQLADIYTVDFSDMWHVLRERRNIRNRIIAIDDKKSRAYFMPRTKSKRKFYVKYLPEEMMGPACVTLSDSLLVMFIYTETTPKVILNRDKEAILAYRKFFERLWKMARNSRS